MGIDFSFAGLPWATDLSLLPSEPHCLPSRVGGFSPPAGDMRTQSDQAVKYGAHEGTAGPFLKRLQKAEKALQICLRSNEVGRSGTYQDRLSKRVLRECPPLASAGYIWARSQLPSARPFFETSTYHPVIDTLVSMWEAAARIWL
jgi:hypothetical protein